MHNSTSPSIRIEQLLGQSETTLPAQRQGELESAPERIQEILGALVRHGCAAELRQGERKVRITPVAFSPELDILQWQVEDTIVSAGRCTISLLGYNSLFRFEVAQSFQHGKKLTTPVPSQILRIRQRWDRRQAVSDLSIRCVLPSGSVIERKVRDVSYGGLAIHHRETADELLLEGEKLNAEVILPAGETVRMRVQVVAVSTGAAGDVCHLAIRRLSQRSTAWFDVVNDRLHPGTLVGSEHSNDVWTLYAECGYFNLSGKTPESFQRLRRAYLSATQQLDRAPQLGTQVVWPNADGQGVNAAISMLKVYQHSWLGFQMARLSGETSDGISGRRVLREIHLRAYEHAQRDPDLRWVIGYTQVKKVWSRLVHHDLPARYAESGDASITRFRALQYAIDAVPATRKPGTVVDRPSADELHDLATRISEQRPAAYCDALDLASERMSMERIRQLYSRNRFERDRAVFVVRHLGKPMAAAVVEMGADGLHVFGLLDLVRLYPLADNGEAYYTDLLGHCAKWFESKGKRDFCLYLEEGQSLPAKTQEAATDMGEADMVILSAKRLPELLEHLHEVTSPRPHQIEISEADPQ